MNERRGITANLRHLFALELLEERIPEKDDSFFLCTVLLS